VGSSVSCQLTQQSVYVQMNMSDGITSPLPDVLIICLAYNAVCVCNWASYPGSLKYGSGTRISVLMDKHMHINANVADRPM